MQAKSVIGIKQTYELNQQQVAVFGQKEVKNCVFDLTAYNTFNLTVFCNEGRTINCLEDLKAPVTAPFIILGGGSDVLFTEDFEGTVLINKIMGVQLSIVYNSGRIVEKTLKATTDSLAINEQQVAPKATLQDKNTISATSNLHQEYNACSKASQSEHEDDEIAYYKVRIGGGEALDEVVELLLDHGINGLENLSLIPGTAGAAPIQNIGAYGVEIGDVIESVEAFDFALGKLITLSQKDCCFGYRTSYFKQNKERRLFITHINLRLQPGFEPKQNYAGLQSMEFKDAQAVRNRVIALRNLKLPNPRHVGNAGSFFKNPYVSSEVLAKLQQQYESVPAYVQDDGSYKLAAGWLIDKAGCRGIRHGQAGTWGNQALVIVNLGQAKPHEIVAMAKYVSAEVKSKFGLDLWPEVRLYGRYGEKEWDQI